MKTLLNLVVVALFLLACGEPLPKKETEPVEKERSYFNQVKTAFTGRQINCLTAQWYVNRYPNEGIVMRVINDQETYESFFSCESDVKLPAINFNANTLIIGMNGHSVVPLNTPINITGIKQSLVETDVVSAYSFKVVVTGAESSNKNGGEWFGFAYLAPKVKGTVTLDISYVYNNK